MLIKNSQPVELHLMYFYLRNSNLARLSTETLYKPLRRLTHMFKVKFLLFVWRRNILVISSFLSFI